MEPIGIENLTIESDLIILGQVTSIESLWDENHTIIITNSTVIVTKILKGNLTNQDKINILSRGGTIDDVNIWVEDEPNFILGQEYGLFLKLLDIDTYSVLGKNQGIVILCNEIQSGKGKGWFDCQTSEEFIDTINNVIQGNVCNEFYLESDVFEIQDLQKASVTTPQIYSISPTKISAGTDSILEIVGSNFGKKSSRRSNADVCFIFKPGKDGKYHWIYASGYHPYTGWETDNENCIISWTDNKIITKVPTGWTFDGSSLYFGSASSGVVRILRDDSKESNDCPISITFGYGKLKWSGQYPTCSFYLNVPNENIKSAITRAANTWNAVPQINFNFNYLGKTDTNTLNNNNGMNEIIWGNTYDQYSLAEAYTRKSAGIIQETDIVFNKNKPWNTANPSANQYDVETTILHEFGHWLKLQDLYGALPGYPTDSQKIMYGFLGQGEIKRSLSEEDKAGIQYIYPITLTPTITTTVTTPTTTPSQTPSPIQVNFTVSRTSGSAPLTVRFQDTSQGNPTGWIWDINGDGFRDYSDKTFDHTYTSPGFYSVTLSITRGQELYTITRTNYIHVISTTPTTTTSSDLTINLHPGWNFISTPKTLKEGHRTAREVFNNVNTGGHSTFVYNTPNQAWNQLNSQDEVEPLQGIWIYSTTSQQVTFVFDNDTATLWTRSLSPGWNTIGFTQINPVSAKDALHPVQYFWSQLIGFNAESQYYDNSIINGGSGTHSDTNLVYPGKGYWIFMNNPGTLS